MSSTKKETELAKVVVGELRERGWTVYQEVTVGGSVCDIVAVSGRVLWAIEAKLSLGMTVLSQAKAWNGAANLVSVAVPNGRRSSFGQLDFAMFMGGCARRCARSSSTSRTPETLTASAGPPMLRRARRCGRFLSAVR
jgi:hypothetical protein